MVGEDFRTDMDSHRRPEGKSNRRRARLRQTCSLCNEPSLSEREQVKHFSSAVHKHMKGVKKKQFSYIKSLRTLDEKIAASEQQNEPLIGLEHIYQYAADKRGVVPYVCTLCDYVYKSNTIFFHIVSVRHRSLYMSKNYPALGIASNFRLKTAQDYTKLLTAAQVIERSHGKRKINVSNTLFNPKKNGDIKYDLESEGEGLSSSEDEQDAPPSRGTDSTSNAKHLHTEERFRGHTGDHLGGHSLPDPAIRYDRRPEGHGAPLRNYEDSGFFYADRGPGDRGPGDRDCSPLPDPAIPYDRRPEGHGAMNLLLRNYEDSGFCYGDRGLGDRGPGDRGPGDRGPLPDPAIRYDRRPEGHGAMNLPLRNYEDSGFCYGDRGPGDRGLGDRGPREERSHPDARRTDFLDDSDPRRGAEFQFSDRPGGPRLSNHGVRTDDGGSRGRVDPPLELLQHHVDYEKIKGLNRTQSRPGNHDPLSEMHRTWTTFGYNDRSDPGHPDHQKRATEVQHNQNPRSLDIPSEDRRPYPSVRYPLDHLPGMASRGSTSPSGHRDGDKQLRDLDRGGFHHDQNRPLRGRADSDFNRPPVEPLHHDNKSHDRTQIRPAGGFGDRGLPSLMNVEGFQREEPHSPLSRDKRRATRWSDPHGDTNMPTPESNDFKSHSRTQKLPPRIPEDRGLRSRMELQNDDDRREAMLRGEATYPDHQNNGRAFAFQRDRSPPLLRDARRGDHEMLHADGRDVHSPTRPRGMAFPYDDTEREMLQDDHKRPRLMQDVPATNSTHLQGDRHAHEDRHGTRDGLQGYPGDHGLHSPRHPRGSSADEQDVANDSDMEVRSMELSDCDPDAFVCNAELFEFLQAFQILSYEDEQFALRVRDMFTSSTIRYKNQKEELLKKRIAEEKEQLEQEKKAFLGIQKARERALKGRGQKRPPKEHQKLLATAAKGNPAAGPWIRFVPESKKPREEEADDLARSRGRPDTARHPPPKSPVKH